MGKKVMKKQKIGFIDAGKVGTALATTLFKGGYPVIAVADTNLRAAEKLSDQVPGCHVSSILKEMASTIGCDWIELKPGDKDLYHAAAVFVSNYFVALLKVATDLFQNFDVPTTQATKVLMPLIQGNIKNINNIGLPN